MQDVITVVTTVGFPIALVVLGLWSVARFVDGRAWPFLTQLVQEWQASERRRADRDAAMDERLITVIENNTRAQQDMSAAIRTIAAQTDTRMARLEKGHRIILHRLKEHDARVMEAGDGA